jgi:hypothetical protein
MNRSEKVEILYKVGELQLQSLILNFVLRAVFDLGRRRK